MDVGVSVSKIGGRGNMALQIGRICGMFLFMRRVTDQGVRPAGQRQSRPKAEREISPPIYID